MKSHINYEENHLALKSQVQDAFDATERVFTSRTVAEDLEVAVLEAEIAMMEQELVEMGKRPLDAEERKA